MLPYKTLEDAEISLGRYLTFSETLWFKYSAQKSDYILYCHNTLFLFIFYTLCPIPFVILELMRSNKIDKFKIQPKIKNSFAHMMNCYIKCLITFLYAVGPLQLLSYPVIQWIGIRTSLPLPSRSEIFWQLLVYFLVEDYANYWLHRMLHCKWGFEKIHRIHHEYTAPISFAAPYAHWAEIIILGFASFLGPLIVPGHMITFWLWFIIRQMEALETHSGYEFPWSPSKFIPLYGGAIYHDYHHYVGGKSHSNFASVFTYCDYIYGTDKGYRYQKKFFEKNRDKRKTEGDILQNESIQLGLKTE
ncbi:hypothetical protein M9H77_33366 [Catharanthus roseus]|uniref:Uncharacterized protein n=1 Tax=Catharanthus roseus TaxID=4058 RepID=A0ACB9ZIA7_CATRO|nr:hypothetical protein M9H77_33366 [Catharanthus roseus]